MQTVRRWCTVMRRCVIAGRVLQGELMDDPGIDRGDHLHALDGLARINRWSFASVPIARAMRAAGERLGRRVRVVDVATGSGDVLLDASRRAGIDTELIATDVSEVALGVVRIRADAMRIACETRRVDVLCEELPEADLAVCTLFLHHLDDDQAAAVLTRMGEAASAGVVSDLRRGVWGTALAGTVPRVMTRSRVVHVDAYRSARAAWSMGEMHGLLDRAGLGGASLRGAFPARMIAEWSAGVSA